MLVYGRATALARPVLLPVLRSLGHQLVGRTLPCRLYSSFSQPEIRPRSFSRRFAAYTALFAATIGGAATYSIFSSDRDLVSSTVEGGDFLAQYPLRSLLRSYIVYTCCKIPWIVDRGPALVDWCSNTSIPGIWPCFEVAVRNFFFAQFVGGETAEECLQTGKDLLDGSIGLVVNYSAETDEKKAKEKVADGSLSEKLSNDKVQAILHLIETTGSFVDDSDGPRTRDSVMVAVKLSGLVKDSSVLERASACIVPRELFSEPPTPLPPSSTGKRGSSGSLSIPISALSQHDVDTLQQLWAALQAIATSAETHGHIRILLDAEYSWYQPAIDALFESCARQFNTLPSGFSSPSALSSVFSFFGLSKSKSNDPHCTHFRGPLIYNTYQAYLRRTPSYLAMSLERAKQGNYALGAKLVRGAYVEQENKEWSTKIVPTPPTEWLPSSSRPLPASPVWPNKDLTDRCYDECADLLLRGIAKDLHSNGPHGFARIGLVLAGHNVKSNMAAVQTMVDTGLASKVEVSQTTPPYRHQLQLAVGVRGRVHFAQLYGMADNLTQTLQQCFDEASGGLGPFPVLKYVPYGDLRLVMPYLVRRAQENKSVMGGGGAQRELSLLAAEIRRRIAAFFT